MRLNPPFSGNKELDSFLNDLVAYVETLENGEQEAGTVGDGDSVTIDYKNRYLHVKYADDKIGNGFSDLPTNKLFLGLLNSSSSVESALYYQYKWYPATFGLSNLLFYKNLGGRGVQLQVTTAAPDATYFVDPGFAIDLDFITADVADGSITTIKLADGAVTLEKLDTTGTPSTTTFLDGDMHWQEHIGVADVHQIGDIAGLQDALDSVVGGSSNSYFPGGWS